MKVEIETDNNGIATKFKINDIDCGVGICGYKIEHKGGKKPIMTLDVGVNELIINGDCIEIKKPKKK